MNACGPKLLRGAWHSLNAAAKQFTEQDSRIHGLAGRPADVALRILSFDTLKSLEQRRSLTELPPKQALLRYHTSPNPESLNPKTLGSLPPAQQPRR